MLPMINLIAACTSLVMPPDDSYLVLFFTYICSRQLATLCASSDLSAGQQLGHVCTTSKLSTREKHTERDTHTQRERERESKRAREKERKRERERQTERESECFKGGEAKVN